MGCVVRCEGLCEMYVGGVRGGCVSGVCVACDGGVSGVCGGCMGWIFCI